MEMTDMTGLMFETELASKKVKNRSFYIKWYEVGI